MHRKYFTMKRIILLMSILGISVMSHAQSQPVKVFEFEPSVGITYGLDNNPGSKQIGPALGLEARWNLRRVPIDLGVQLSLGSAVSSYYDDDLSCRTVHLFHIVADYNFNRGAKVSPFAGLTMGLNGYAVVEGELNDNSDGSGGFGVCPRIGVELWRHLRLTLSCNVARNHYKYLGFNVGYAFGRGLKSK